MEGGKQGRGGREDGRLVDKDRGRGGEREGGGGGGRKGE